MRVMSSQELELSIRKPTIFVLAPRLWGKSTLIVKGVGIGGPPDYVPVSELICAIRKPEDVRGPLHLELDGDEFRHAALVFLLATAPANTGSMTVDVARAQDLSPTPPHHPPKITVEFTRAASDDVVVEKTVVLKAVP